MISPLAELLAMPVPFHDMKLSKLFRRAVEIGISADPRGAKEVQRLLRKEKEKFEKLEGKEKEYADEDRLWNPYPDSRILWGEGDEDIQHLLVGIDIETPEILLADLLRKKGKRIDAIFIHHPEGRALADLEHVMPVQVDVLAELGVPLTRAEAQLRPRMDKIRRAIHADNLFRTERAAELLDFPTFTCHTVTDNLVWALITKVICKRRGFHDLGEILNALLEIPEYAYYAKKGNPPIIVHGSRNNRPGKIAASEFTGGTNGPEEFLEEQSRAGVGTILSMHVTEKTWEKAKEHHVNLIQCSHMASDAIGINLLLDRLQKEEKKLSTFEISGFIRVKR